MSLERFARSETIFPGADDATGNWGMRSDYANRFGGEVRGYWHEDNPIVRVGATEDGQDFAITPERFLADSGPFRYYCDSPVVDLTDASARAEAAARTGLWRRGKRCR